MARGARTGFSKGHRPSAAAAADVNPEYDPIVFPPWLAAERSRDSTSPLAKSRVFGGTVPPRCYGSPKRHIIPDPWESTGVKLTYADSHWSHADSHWSYADSRWTNAAPTTSMATSP